MSWRAVFAIARKDLLDAFKNLYILSALVLPIVLSLLFRLAFASPLQGLGSTVVIYDPSGSRLSAALRQSPGLTVADATSREQLPAEVERQAVAGLDVPPGFDAALQSGTRPELTLYVNRGHGGGEIAAFERLLDGELRALAGQELPVRLGQVALGGNAVGTALGSLNPEAYLLVMLLVLSVTMSGTFAVPILLVEEKEKHTLDVLLVSPATAADIVLGKGLVGLVYCALGSLILVVLNRGWQGAWALTFAAICAGSAFAVLVGLLMGGLFRTTGQVNTWSSVVMIVMILPTWFTLTSPVGPLSIAIKLIPTYYLAEALGMALAGVTDWGRLGLDLGIVGACAAAALVGVIWLLRREDR